MPTVSLTAHSPSCGTWTRRALAQLTARRPPSPYSGQRGREATKPRMRSSWSRVGADTNLRWLFRSHSVSNTLLLVILVCLF